MPKHPTSMQRYEELTRFVAEHQRMPSGRYPDEKALYAWTTRVLRGELVKVDPTIAERVTELHCRFKQTPRQAGIRALTGANIHRAREAADRAARAAVEALDRAPQQYRRILQARAEHPRETLTDVAARLGMTKYAYAGQLRRALQLANCRNH